jgi:hypothetical protein
MEWFDFGLDESRETISRGVATPFLQIREAEPALHKLRTDTRTKGRRGNEIKRNK